jgi:predicted nucleotidyltransferase
MKVCGLIVEYNPLHNGHLYHLQKAKELTDADIFIAVMSGNFVQRGEFALIDKWTRAEAAVNAGVDIVFELPFVFTVQSATQFGRNAVEILANAKCDYLVFGSETNNLEELKEIASISFNIDNFKETMKKGYSYPAAYGFFADSYGPNDILAISYLRALQNHPEITPFSVKRTSNYHNDNLDEFLPSAKAIRTALKDNKNITDFTPMKELDKYPSPDWNSCYGYIRNLLLNTPKKQLKEIFLMNEGIENHLYKCAYKSYCFEQFISMAITKRYTRSRIQRTLCHLLIHNTKNDMKQLPEYDTLRPLAFSLKGQQYLKLLQKQEVKIANNFTANIKQYRDIEFKAAIAYSINMDDDMKEYITRSEISGLNYKK